MSTTTHLDLMSTSTPIRSRKSERVYRSPSHVNDPSPFSKVKRETSMDIDAEDEEAGTILMALAQHAERILNHPHHLEKSTNKSTMSIRNLLDNESSTSKTSPYNTKPFYDSRKHSQQKKGFQICLAQRLNKQQDHKPSFRPPNNVQKPILSPSKTFLKRNSTHIRISYRIHAHRVAMTTPSLSASSMANNKYEYTSSAFKPSHRWREKSFYQQQQQQQQQNV